MTFTLITSINYTELLTISVQNTCFSRTLHILLPQTYVRDKIIGVRTMDPKPTSVLMNLFCSLCIFSFYFVSFVFSLFLSVPFSLYHLLSRQLESSTAKCRVKLNANHLCIRYSARLLVLRIVAKS